jgi:hypothetical protein
VDAMDSARNTALHILVRNPLTDKSMAIIDFLCNNAGAHKDFANNQGNSPIQDHDIMPHHKRVKIQQWRQKLGVTPLKCHCARLAKYGRLPYQKYLSSSLVNFVYKH